MKNVKIIVKILFAVITVVFIFSVIISAEGVERFEFDGIGDAVSLKDAIDNVDVSISSDIHPVIESLGDKINVDYSTVDYSIINAIKYCEKNGASKNITDGLKNLLIYGTEEEKISFLQSDKYFIPVKFFSIPVPLNYNFIQKTSKSLTQVCRQENCRTEQVCGNKEVCEQVRKWVCRIVGGGGGAIAGGVIGGAIGGAVTGTPGGSTAGATAGGGVGYDTGKEICEWVTENVCRDVEDCSNIEVCDTVCEWKDVQPGECVTTVNGQTVCQ